MELALNEKCFTEFLKIIHDLTGITISTNRISMVEGRLRKRITALRLQSYEDYLQVVREDKNEQVLFVNTVTTNETYFFRTPRIWQYIESKVLPEWLIKHPKKVFTVWSAAASSGEEAHSLGILCQSFKDKNPSFTYQILGTDISHDMIALCLRGEYSGKSIEMFRKTRPELFNKYMKPTQGDAFQAAPEVRSRIRFQYHNLFNPLQKSDPFDLVLLRNVLIYFTGNDQEKVISLIAPRLAKDGTLIIGESESLSHIKTQFKHIEPLVYQLNPSPDTISKAV